jgi:hypothetical protein
VFRRRAADDGLCSGDQSCFFVNSCIHVFLLMSLAHVPTAIDVDRLAINVSV